MSFMVHNFFFGKAQNSSALEVEKGRFVSEFVLLSYSTFLSLSPSPYLSFPLSPFPLFYLSLYYLPSLLLKGVGEKKLKWKSGARDNSIRRPSARGFGKHIFGHFGFSWTAFFPHIRSISFNLNSYFNSFFVLADFFLDQINKEFKWWRFRIY